MIEQIVACISKKKIRPFYLLLDDFTHFKIDDFLKIFWIENRIFFFKISRFGWNGWLASSEGKFMAAEVRGWWGYNNELIWMESELFQKDEDWSRFTVRDKSM